jgi:hypothetical protein
MHAKLNQSALEAESKRLIAASLSAKQKAKPVLNELLTLLESTANMLRGMTLDPAIPKHTKEAMQCRIASIEATVEKYLP